MSRHRRNRPRRLSLGTISHGTLRPEDVIPALLDAADSVRMNRDDRQRVQRLAKEWESLPADCQTGDDVEIWDDLLGVLDGYAPDYCYVGAHEGDGADIGVWPVSDVLTGDYYRDECPRIAAGDDAPERLRGLSHYIAVSDHGNATLYRRAGNRWVECWSVV